MSDFDLYDGQNCRCGNDPMCTNCGSGAAYAAQCEAEEQARQHYEEQARVWAEEQEREMLAQERAQVVRQAND